MATAKGYDWPKLREVMETLIAEVGDSDTMRVCVAALLVGANQRRVQRLTGLPMEFVREKGEALKANGVWLADGHVSVESEDGYPDGVELALWSLAADGLIEAA